MGPVTHTHTHTHTHTRTHTHAAPRSPSQDTTVYIQLNKSNLELYVNVLAGFAGNTKLTKQSFSPNTVAFKKWCLTFTICVHVLFPLNERLFIINLDFLLLLRPCSQALMAPAAGVSGGF